MQIVFTADARDITDVEELLTMMQQLAMPRAMVEERDGAFRLTLSGSAASYITYIAEVAYGFGGREFLTYEQWCVREEAEKPPEQGELLIFGDLRRARDEVEI